MSKAKNAIDLNKKISLKGMLQHMIIMFFIKKEINHELYKCIVCTRQELLYFGKDNNQDGYRKVINHTNFDKMHVFILINNIIDKVSYIISVMLPDETFQEDEYNVETNLFLQTSASLESWYRENIMKDGENKKNNDEKI